MEPCSEWPQYETAPTTLAHAVKSWVDPSLLQTRIAKHMSTSLMDQSAADSERTQTIPKMMTNQRSPLVAVVCTTVLNTHMRGRLEFISALLITDSWGTVPIWLIQITVVEVQFIESRDNE